MGLISFRSLVPLLGILLAYIQVDAQIFGRQSVARIRGCTPQQESTVRKTDLQMQARIDEVVAGLPKLNLQSAYEKFVLPKNRQWSAGSIQNRNYQRYHAKLLQVFQAMQRSSHSGINFECKSNSEFHCQNGEVIAYVLFVGNSPLQNLYLCSGFFRDQSDGQEKDGQEKQETLLHELSHYAASTDDLAGSWQDAVNPDIVHAADDAYHIQSFSSEDLEKNILRQIWFWNWPAKPKNSD